MKQDSLELYLTDETATLDLGKTLAMVCDFPCVIFLEGELGSGKTTLVRGFLRALGYQGTVKSPTYTFVEPYEIAQGHIFHFDLYRLPNLQELNAIGFQDYFKPDTICLLEWGQYAKDLLPYPDLRCKIKTAASGRQLKITAFSTHGQEILVKLASKI